MSPNLKKAQSKAHTPEANAKRAATIAAKKLAASNVVSIPLSAIPDDPPKRKSKKVVAKNDTHSDIIRNLSEAVVLMLRSINK